MSDLLPEDPAHAPIHAPRLRGRVEARHDAEDVFDALAADLMAQAVNCVGKTGEFHLALSGGKTPFPFYEKLMVDPRYRALPWGQTHLWMVDERRIGFESELNNYRHIHEILVEHSGIPEANVHPMPVADATPDVTYERALREALGRRPQGQQRLDFVLLGMGDNGHTASLFPHTEVLKVRDRLVGLCDGPTVTPPPRITLTYPAINAARFVAVLVMGAAKGPMLKRVSAGHDDLHELPIMGIEPAGGDLRWYLDRAACDAAR
jgi:6-phosphogluconolactonase